MRVYGMMVAFIVAGGLSLVGCRTMEGAAADLFRLADLAGQGVDTMNDGAECAGRGVEAIGRMCAGQPDDPVNPYQ